MQSSYLEAVLKYIVDFQVFTATKENDETDEKKSKILREIRKSYTKKSLYELTIFLHEVGVFSNEVKENLHEYRSKRNKVLHDLITQIRDEKFDSELRLICELGEKILDDNNFSRMAKMIQIIEADYEKAKKTRTIAEHEKKSDSA